MKIKPPTIAKWTKKAASWLKTNHDLELSAIVTEADAWAVASYAGITAEAYKDRTVTDGHIQSALERIFPKAVFKSRKVY
jgi:hypothetical protein